VPGVRRGSARVEAGADHAPRGVRRVLGRLLGALTGGRRKARGWLHSILRDEARRARMQGELAMDAASPLGPALAAVFGARRARHHASPATALLAQITYGISNAGRPIGGFAP
jgi:hypothetical protein